MTELTLTGLRVLREVAARGSFTAAAGSLGYTQPAVSRQIAALEAAAGQPLFERGPGGARLTPAGGRLLARAGRILGEVDAAQREAAGDGAAGGTVRLGAFAAAAAGLVPGALAALARSHPELAVTVREAATPALVRSLRAGTLDLAIVAATQPFRPFDGESPPFAVTVLSQAELLVGVGADHPFAGRGTIEVAELTGQRWVTSREEAGETLLGVWPGLPGRPDVAFVVRDWLAKLALVAAGLAITTVPPVLRSVVPPGVRLLSVRGEPQEQRRVVVATVPGAVAPGTTAMTDALVAALG